MKEIVYAALISGLIGAIASPGVISFLTRLKAGQPIRKDGPKHHAVKAGTPTMGGVIIIVAASLSTLLVATERSEHAGVLLVAMIGYGLIGLIDDFMKVVKKRSLGLKARLKLIGQLVIAVFVAVYAYQADGIGTGLIIPFTGDVWTVPTIFFFIIAIGTVVGASNAVNITDGLDGLAAGSSAIATLIFSVISWRLGYPDVAVFAAAIAGACFAFAWFNAHPAIVIMGDTGSMALGAALGAIAVLTQTEFVLFIVGGLFVIETLSVIIQVLYFRVTKGKRIFKMSPLHHHFELSGWAEPQIVTRFWLISVTFGLIGLLSVYV